MCLTSKTKGKQQDRQGLLSLIHPSQGIIILSERPQGWSHTCHNSQHPRASRSLRLLHGNSSGMRTQDPSGGSWDRFVWIGMIMSTQAPAQADCLDNFWALERANQSRSHWRQWKNSSSLQRALDAAHTAAVSDRESGVGNYSQKRQVCPQNWDILAIISAGFVLPGNLQGGNRERKITLQHLISVKSRTKSNSLMSASLDFCLVFSIHILTGTSSIKALNSLLPRETLLTERNSFRASTHPK